MTTTTVPTFDQLGLNETTLASVRARGYTTPTPIQAGTIPLLLQGEDVIGQAQTGTGKTAAFGLPIIEATRTPGISTLVLCPTRELANQIVEELNAFAKGTRFKAMAIYGGVGFGNQIGALRRGDVTCLVACPGRLLDLIERGEARLAGVRRVVLDEADRMLDMGFIRDIDRIFKHLPRERQTMLFSATMPNEVRRLAERYLHAPEFVRAETGPTATELTDQFRIDARGDKVAILLALLEKENPGKTVVFTRTKHGAKRLAKRLAAQGYDADSLQGNLSQNARDRVMAAFRTGEVDLLVATDVAARGLDVSDVTHVVNFDLPTVAEDYVHRIGRTGRAGKRGRAFLFVERDQQRDVKDIERASGVRMDDYDLGHVPPAPPAPAETRPARPPSRAQPQRNGPRGAHRPGGSGGPRRGPPSRGPSRGPQRSGGGGQKPRGGAPPRRYG